MTDEQSIKEKILAAEDDSIFFRSDFPEHHSESVGRVLSQLTDENLLVRIASGIYVKPRMSRFGPVMPSVDKLAALYSSWLDTEEEGWNNDCEVIGKIIAEQAQDDCTADQEIIMENIEMVGGNILVESEFSGGCDIPFDRHRLGLEHDKPHICFSMGGAAPFGDFLMCRAFRCLYLDSLYAPQDILKIKHYWCDVSITHQRIVNNKGELQ